MRCFLAFDFDAQSKAWLARVQSAWLDALDAASQRALRLTPPAAFHTTLRFLGEIDDVRRRALESALPAIVAQHAPLRCALAGCGAFPSLASPRVLWLGLECEGRALESLQSKLEDAAQELGLDEERLPFRPHATIARVDRRLRSGERRALGGACTTASSACEGLRHELEFSEVVLMQSKAGPRYEVLASFPLCAT